MILSKYIIAGWFALMSIIAGYLVYESYVYKQHIEELGMVKQDYSNYVLALKKLIFEFESAKDTLDTGSEDQKKKDRVTRKAEDQDFSLMVVNREPTYLRESALAFARNHNIEGALLRALDHEQSLCAQDKALSKRRISRRRWNTSDSSTAIPKRFNRLEYLSKKLQQEPVFMWPIDRSQFWLSSVYGPRKLKGVWGFHKGIDLCAPRGTPVKAADNGVVIEAGWARGYGLSVVISHNKKFKTRYAHLDKILTKVGQKVVKGDYIGKVGSTGHVIKRNGDGSHLHFEVYVYGKQVNPFYFLA